jgi:Squalene/phytoene synthase
MQRFLQIINVGLYLLLLVHSSTKKSAGWTTRVIGVVQAWTPPIVDPNRIQRNRIRGSCIGHPIVRTFSKQFGDDGTSLKNLYSLAAPSYENSSSSSSSINNNGDTHHHSSESHINHRIGHNNHVVSLSGASSNIGGGRLLEGGKVIDFSSVKASSKAETALAAARQLVLQQQQQHNIDTRSNRQTAEELHHQPFYFASPLEESPRSQDDAILGINQDVIEQVGHDLGIFCSAQEVQKCAAYLRSKAPTGLFISNTDVNHRDDASSSATNAIAQKYQPSDVARYEAIIAQAYDEAGEVTSAFAKTFYMGTMLMSEHARRAIWAVYVWCRRTDEIVDAPRDDDNEMLMDLSLWELRLEQLWQTGVVVDVYDLCLLHTRIQYPTMDIQPFMDMIRGMLMDVPDLGMERYENFDELHLYCYRVAGTVGVMSLPVFGCAPGYNEDIARYVCENHTMYE